MTVAAAMAAFGHLLVKLYSVSSKRQDNNQTLHVCIRCQIYLNED